MGHFQQLCNKLQEGRSVISYMLDLHQIIYYYHLLSISLYIFIYTCIILISSRSSHFGITCHAGSAGCQVATTCAAHYESAAGSIATWDGKNRWVMLCNIAGIYGATYSTYDIYSSQGLKHLHIIILMINDDQMDNVWCGS